MVKSQMGLFSWRVVMGSLLAAFVLLSMATVTWALPTVTGYQPGNGAIAPPSAKVQATFSEPMDPASLSATNFSLSRFMGAKAIATGSSHALAVMNDGTVVGWGDNYYGQLAVPAGLSGVVAVAAGAQSSVALKGDGAVVGWGTNPTVPAGLTDVIAIAAGDYHALALKSNGTVVAWGSNNYGESNVPATATGVVAIAAKGMHSLALKSDGTVVAWGYNWAGMSTVPASLSGVTVTAIAAGLGNSYALKADGTVVSWGEGAGQAPAGLSGIVAISGTLALKNDGTVVPWASKVVPAGLVGVAAIANDQGQMLALLKNGKVVAWNGYTGAVGSALVGMNEADPTIPATLTYDSGTDTATVTPSFPLISGATYYVVVTDVRSQGGLPLAAPVRWSFTAKDVAPITYPENFRANTIQLPQSGQSDYDYDCFDAVGNQITCAGSGQDGATRAGKSWPAPRFTDTGNGTVTDSLTGLIWLKNTDCYGQIDWLGAIANTSALASGVCDLNDGSAAGQWRLPTATEIEYLVKVTWPALTPYPFIALDYYTLSHRFWTSTTVAGDTSNAWSVEMANAGIVAYPKTYSTYMHMWPVRVGTTTAVPKTGQVTSYAAGDDGALEPGVQWPIPRFVDNSNGTVTDALTGLIWLKNANCFNSTKNWIDALSIANGLATGACGLTDGSQASDWRLPSRRELFSLVNFGEQNSALWLATTSPLVNVLAENYWTSNTATATNLADHIANNVNLQSGSANWDGKTDANSDFVWPVRGGQFGTAAIAVQPAIGFIDGVAPGASGSRTITIANNAPVGAGKLQISSMFLYGGAAAQFSIDVGDGSSNSCGSLTPIINAGSSCTISVSFSPVTVGSVAAHLAITNSTVNTPYLDVSLVGNPFSVTASVTSGNGSIISANPVQVATGATASFTLSPDSGYQVSSNVSGSCASGSLNGNSYSTGAIVGDCTVGFSFIDVVPPVTTATPAGGMHASPQNVTLTTNEPSTIFFTIDGSIPTTGSSVYSAPILISSSTTLKYFALDMAGNSEAVQSQSYGIYGQGQFPWSTKAPLPYGLSRAFSAVSNGKIFILGGAPPTSSVISYDPVVNSWSYHTALPMPMFGGASVAQGTIIYLLGGMDINGNYLNSVIAYNTINGNSTPVGTLVYPRARMNAALLNNKIYVVGGSGAMDTIEEYDLVTNTSRVAATLPEPTTLAGVAAYQGKIIIAAGGTGNTKTWSFDPASGMFTFLSPLPTSAEARNLIVNNDRLYLVEGRGYGNINYVFEYNLTMNSWNSITTVPTFRNVPTVEAVNGVMYVMGGETAAFTPGIANEAWQFGSALPDQGIITTMAGNGLAGYFGDGAAATQTSLNYPEDVTLDNSGNIYIADTANNRIRKVDKFTGAISTVAGNGVASYSGDGGPAEMAGLNRPFGVAIDNSGNIYISDTANARVRKVTQITGMITTIAGNGINGYSGDGGSAIEASLGDIRGIAVDSEGNIYIADSGHNRIRKVDQANGLITTVAFGNHPEGVTLDSNGNLYYAETWSNVIVKMDKITGATTIVAGNGTSNYSGDGGAATAASLNFPHRVVLDGIGNIYISDSSNNRIRKVDSGTGLITTVAGTGIGSFSGDGGVATSAGIAAPKGISVDSSGNVYFADIGNNRVRKVTFNQPVDPTPPITTAMPAGGYYPTAQNVTLTTNRPATIYYTVNSTEPTTSSSIYYGPISISQSTTLRFFATAGEGNSESVKTENYLINGLPVWQVHDVNQANPSWIDWLESQHEALPYGSYLQIDGTIYYVNADPGSWNGSGYYAAQLQQCDQATRQPLTTTVTRTFQNCYWDNTDIMTPTWVCDPPFNYQVQEPLLAELSGKIGTQIIDVSPPITTASPASGIYPTAQTVTLTTNKAGTIYFTTDGTEPTTFSAEYGGPITISSSTILKFFARDAAGNSETPVKAEWYTILVDQSVSFAPLTAKTYGDTNITLNATATSGLPVSYFSSNPAVATVSGNVLQIVGAGSTIITAYQEGDSVYSAATQVDQLFTVNKAASSITLNSITPNASTYGDQLTISATVNPTTASGKVKFSSGQWSQLVDVLGGSAQLTTTTIPAGIKTITAQYQGNINYLISTSTGLTQPINKANQSITFLPIAAKPVNGAPFLLDAIASSGLPISYTSTNPAVATISGSTVTIVGLGTTAIIAGQSGDSNYTDAAFVSQPLVVEKATAIITLGNLAVTYDGTQKAVTAITTPEGLAVAVTYNGSTTAPTNVGSYPVVATVNTATFQGSASATLVIGKAGQTILFAELPMKTYGDPAFAVNATASSGLGGVSFASSNQAVATVNGATITIVGAGSSTITASQLGDGNYEAASPATWVLTVNKAAATVTLGNLTAIYTGTPKAATATTTPADLNLEFTYDALSGAPTNVGSYAVVGTINNANYLGSTTGTLNIAKATTQVNITTTSPNPSAHGQAVTITAVVSPAGGTGQVEFSNGLSWVQLGPVNAVNGSATVTSSTLPAGGNTITARYLGDSNHDQSPLSAGVSQIVNKANQTINFAPLPNKMAGDVPFELSATAISGLGVSFSSSDNAVARVNGSWVTIVGPGTATIIASQWGNDNHNAAVAVPQTLTVISVQQGIKMNDGGSDRYFNTLSAAYSDITNGANASIQLPVITLTEALLFNKNLQVTIKGGYDASGNQVGVTSIQGSMTIQSGSVTIDGTVCIM